MYLIRLTLLDGTCETWIGFLRESGEPCEYDTIEAAREGVEALKSGKFVGGLFEAWDVTGEERPTVGHVEIMHAVSVE